MIFTRITTAANVATLWLFDRCYYRLLKLSYFKLREVVEQLEERGVENTGWSIFRDDGWVVLPGGIADVPVVEEILQNLHPAGQLSSGR